MRQNPHVRICGGPGSATTLVYPTGSDGHVGEVARPAPLEAGVRVPSSGPGGERVLPLHVHHR